MFCKGIYQGAHLVVPELDVPVVEGCQQERPLGMERETLDTR